MTPYVRNVATPINIDRAEDAGKQAAIVCIDDYRMYAIASYIVDTAAKELFIESYFRAKELLTEKQAISMRSIKHRGGKNIAMKESSFANIQFAGVVTLVTNDHAVIVIERKDEQNIHLKIKTDVHKLSIAVDDKIAGKGILVYGPEMMCITASYVYNETKEVDL